MKVAHVTNLYVPHNLGGAEVNCFELVGHQRRAGHDVRVFTNERGRAFDDPGVVNLDLPVDPTTTALLLPQKAADRRLHEALKEFGPDVVHVHNVHRTLGFGTYGVAALWPNVVTIQDYHLFCLKTENYREEGRACNDRSMCAACASTFYPMQAKAIDPSRSTLLDRLPQGAANALWRVVPLVRNAARERWFNRWIDLVICPSSAVRETMVLWGIDPQKICLIGNAVPLQNIPVNAPQSQPVRPPSFGYIGKLTRAKGVHVLIEAFRRISPSVPGARLLVAGDGLDAEALQNAAGDAAIEFLGRVPRDGIDTFYDAVDAVVVPSIWPDVMPLVVLEAMARGKAVIVSRIGGMPDQVGDAGIVVRSNDAAELADAMLRLTQRDEFSKRSALSRERFEKHYSPELIARQTEDLYARAIQEHGKRRHQAPA